MLEYRTVEQDLDTPETGPYHTFGIRLLERQKGTEMEVLTVMDVSPDRKKVDGLAKLFTEQQLSPIHLREVLDDVL